jgi:hypothetical protein
MPVPFGGAGVASAAPVTVTFYPEPAVDFAIAGYNGVGDHADWSAWIEYEKFTAVSLTAATFYIYTLVAGNVKVAIYDATGAGGVPGALVWNTASAVGTNTWNAIAISSTKDLTAGSCWLAYGCDATATVKYLDNQSSVTCRYASFATLGTTYASYTYPATWSATGYTATDNTYKSSVYLATGAPVSSSDGYVQEKTDVETWATKHDNTAGTTATHNSAALYVDIYSSATNAKWYNIIRSWIQFDTSSIPDGACITSATLSLYGVDKGDPAAWGIKGNIFAATPASTTTLVVGDFDQCALAAPVAFSSDITYASWSTTGYNDYALNAAGIANILDDGTSAFSWRESAYDAISASGTAPAYSASKEAWLGAKSSEAGTEYRPKLVIVYLGAQIDTLAATSITTTSATLNGNVTLFCDYGNVTSYGFVLSTSTQSNPGNVSPSAQTTYTAGNWTWTGVNYGAGQTFNSNGNVTGLSKGTCYYFRAAGYSTYGWTYGDEITFIAGCVVSATVYPSPAVVALGNTATFGTAGLGGYLWMQKFQCTASGTAYSIRFYSRVAVVGCKVALYDDDGGSGEPGTLLAVNNTGEATYANIWMSEYFDTPVAIVVDNWYYIGVYATADCLDYGDTTGKTDRFKAGTSFPSTWNAAGDTHDTTLQFAMNCVIQPTDSCDGPMVRSWVNESWATIRDNAVATRPFYGDSPHLSIQICSSGTTNKWFALERDIITFPPFNLPINAVIVSATLSVYGNQKADGLNLVGTGGFSANVYSATPANVNTLAVGDYDSMGTTAYATAVSYTNWSTTGYNSFAFNATGIAAISKTAANSFGLREVYHDVGNNIPTWSSLADSYMRANVAFDGTSYRPKLEICYYLEPSDISNTPSLWSVGVVQPLQTYWPNGAEPGTWPLTSAECVGNVTNLSSFTLTAITVVITDFSGTTSINIVSTVPGANEARLMLFTVGDGNNTDGLYLTNAAQNFSTTVAADEVVYWELKLETGRMPAGVYSGNMTFATDPVGDSEVVAITFTMLGSMRREIILVH